MKNKQSDRIDKINKMTESSNTLVGNFDLH